MCRNHSAVNPMGHRARTFKKGNPGHKDAIAASAAHPSTAPLRANPMQKEQRPSFAEITPEAHRKRRVFPIVPPSVNSEFLTLVLIRFTPPPLRPGRLLAVPSLPI